MRRVAVSARIGGGCAKAALAAQGRRLAVVDAAEIDDDLVLGMTCLLTSMCARLYGKGAAVNPAYRSAALVSEPPRGDGG